MRLLGRLKRLERHTERDYPPCGCTVIRMFDHEPTEDELPHYPCPACGRPEWMGGGVAFIVIEEVVVEPNPPLPAMIARMTS